MTDQPDPIRVVIVDDHPMMRDGLRHVLAPQPDIDVVGEAADGRDAVDVIRSTSPDVVLMDLQMPELDGVGALRALATDPGSPAVLVLTTYDTDADIYNAIDAGAAGYLLKDAPADQILAAVRALARGEPALAAPVAARLMNDLRGGDPSALTPRELEVLGLAGDGLTNHEIARSLHIGEATVKSHLVHIYRKLGVDDRTHAVTTALKKGLIRLGVEKPT